MVKESQTRARSGDLIFQSEWPGRRVRMHHEDEVKQTRLGDRFRGVLPVSEMEKRKYQMFGSGILKYGGGYSCERARSRKALSNEQDAPLVPPLLAALQLSVGRLLLLRRSATPLRERHATNMNRNNGDNVLSLSAEAEPLAKREACLLSAGHQVLSTTSETHIRFEVQMGSAACYYSATQSTRQFTATWKLFTRNCKGCAIVFVMHPEQRKESPHAHLNLLDADFPHKLHLIRHAHTHHNKSA